MNHMGCTSALDSSVARIIVAIAVTVMLFGSVASSALPSDCDNFQ